MEIFDLASAAGDTETYHSGEVIFAEGSVGDCLYVLIEGEVMLSVRTLELETIGPGEMFGEMALIDARPRSASATAKSECRVSLVNEERFNYLVQQKPSFALLVMRTLVSRLRAMDDAINSAADELGIP